MFRKIASGLLVASALVVAPLAAHAQCISFLESYATAPYHEYGDEQSAWECENDLGLVALCQSQGKKFEAAPGPLGRVRYTCELPSHDENALEQATAIFTAVREGLVQAVPYVIDGITGLTCLAGDPISCGIIGNQILNAVHNDSVLSGVMGSFAAGAACVGVQDASKCVEALFGAFASSAVAIPGPVGDFARQVNGVEQCVSGDGSACLALGTQIALDQTGLGISLDGLGDATARLQDCSNGDYGSCAFLGDEVSRAIHAGTLADNLLHGASGALDCVLSADQKACMTLAGQAAGVTGVNAMLGETGACFGANATIASCQSLAIDVGNAAGVGGSLRDLTSLGSDAGACGGGDTVACASLGAHAAVVLGVRGQPGDQPAGTSGVRRCGHADPAACATYGAAVAALENKNQRVSSLDVLHCRLSDDQSPTACAYLGWAAANSADEVLPGSRAAQCLAEGPMITAPLPTGAQPANTTLAPTGGTPTSPSNAQLSPALTQQGSSSSGGMVVPISPVLLPPTTPSNQIDAQYGRGCQLLGHTLAGNAGQAELSGLNGVLAAGQSSGAVTGSTTSRPSNSKLNVKPE